MLVSDITPLDEETLAHFGVKGMRWGVRKEEEGSGRKGGSEKKVFGSDNPYAATDKDRAVLKAAGVKASDAPAMKSKYGPGSLNKKSPKAARRLTDEQKDTIKSLLIIGGAAAAVWYLHHKGNQLVQDDYFRRINPVEGAGGGKGAFRKEWMGYIKTAGGRESGYTKEMVSKLSDDPVSLKAGAIFKRVSTERETQIRPGGFYAAYKDEDVNRYKAMLPVFWKQWGKGGSSGYVVNLKANGDVNAPSPKKTYEMMKGMLNDEVEVAHLGKRRFRDLFPTFGLSDDDEVARKIFPQAAANWVNEEHPGTKHFFARLKGEGYNAVVDMNDAGALSSRPMRLLDGSMFSVSGHDRLSSQAIAKAQENIQAIAHAIRAMLVAYTMRGEEYLAHDGVKGMKWGRRKAREPGAPDHRRRNEIVLKAAIGVGVVAVAAILMKRGGIPMSSPAAKKITLGGAKAAYNIVSKSGRLMATTSVKLGKVAGKGGAKAGTLAGKGAYKGALAGSKAAGRAIAQNGSKVYEKGIKNTARSAIKLGNHAMYKFAGRGKPIVEEVAKKSFNLSPTDLLLNVRADKWRGR